MKRTIITIKISRLKLYYKWFSVLHFVTNKKNYFDRKIKIGITIISLMTVLNSCKNESYTKKADISDKSNIAERKVVLKNDTTEVIKNQKFKAPEIVDSAYNEYIDASCYLVTTNIEIDTAPEIIQVTCYEVVAEPEPEIEIYYETYQLEEQPIFEGGDEKLFNFIQSNIVYPEIARQVNIQGTVFVKFIITKFGKVEGGTVMRGVEENLDNEALRVISILPDFIPGKIKGKAVNCWFVVPVKF